MQNDRSYYVPMCVCSVNLENVNSFVHNFLGHTCWSFASTFVLYEDIICLTIINT